MVCTQLQRRTVVIARLDHVATTDG